MADMVERFNISSGRVIIGARDISPQANVRNGTTTLRRCFCGVKLCM
jgi:hypothetical protein